jgi:hypothetical protein
LLFLSTKGKADPADGVNRPNGKPTAPSPQDSQLAELFLVLPQAVFGWDGAGKLIPVLGGDERTASVRGNSGAVAEVLFDTFEVGQPLS